MYLVLVVVMQEKFTLNEKKKKEATDEFLSCLCFGSWSHLTIY